MSDGKHTTIYLSNQENKERVFGLEPPDPNTRYIIMQNDMLQTRIKEIESENIRISADIVLKEDECDDMDERLRYIKGELKNFVELRNMSSALSKLTNINYNALKEHQKNTAVLTKRICTYILVDKLSGLLTVLVLWYLNKLTLTNIIFALMSTTGVNMFSIRIPSTINKYKLSDTENIKIRDANMNQIHTIVKEMKKTDESNDFISKYIESL